MVQHVLSVQIHSVAIVSSTDSVRMLYFPFTPPSVQLGKNISFIHSICGFSNVFFVCIGIVVRIGDFEFISRINRMENVRIRTILVVVILIFVVVAVVSFVFF